MIEKDAYVPQYFDHETLEGIENLVASHKNLKSMSLGELLEKEYLRDLWIERCFMHKGKRRRSKNARTSY